MPLLMVVRVRGSYLRFVLVGGLGEHDRAPGAPVVQQRVIRVSLISQSAGGAIISWASTNAGFVLEQSASLTFPINWVSNTDTISDDGTTRAVTVPMTNDLQLFRLRKP